MSIPDLLRNWSPMRGQDNSSPEFRAAMTADLDRLHSRDFLSPSTSFYHDHCMHNIAFLCVLSSRVETPRNHIKSDMNRYFYFDRLWETSTYWWILKPFPKFLFGINGSPNSTACWDPPCRSVSMWTDCCCAVLSTYCSLWGVTSAQTFSYFKKRNDGRSLRAMESSAQYTFFGGWFLPS